MAAMTSATRLLSLAALLIAGCSQSSPAPDRPLQVSEQPKTVTIYVAGMNDKLQIL